MIKYKVATTEIARGISIHNDLKSARLSQKKHGARYRIYRSDETLSKWFLVS